MKITIKDLGREIDAIEIICKKNPEDLTIDSILPIEDFDNKPSSLCWCSFKNQDMLATIVQGVIIVDYRIEKNRFNDACTYILVSSPREAFRKLMQKAHEELYPPVFSIKSKELIHPSAIVGQNADIGYNVIISENVTIGNNASIGHNSVILRNTQIGNNVKIGCNSTIGGIGFGYEKNESKEYQLIQHLGNVIIEDNVEIGNNSCIDRAVLGSTLIGYNVKIDNLVHIAHGVKIGRNSVIIANAMIGGSTEIGANVWVSPSASLINKIKISDDVIVGMGAVVLKSADPGQVLVGNPAKRIEK